MIDHIDRENELPLYCQLREILRRQIDTGVLKPGDQLPPEPSLCQAHGLSRITVRQALADLVDEGYVHRSRGKGTFVAERKLLDRRVDRISSFVATLRDQGYNPVPRILEITRVPAPAKVATKLEISEGQPIIRYRRMVTVDGAPIAIATGYVFGGPDLELDVTTFEQYPTIVPYLDEHFGIQLVRGNKTLEATLANDDEAHHLGIKKGAPVLLSESVLFTDDDRPCVFIKVAYRGDRYTYYVRMVG